MTSNFIFFSGKLPNVMLLLPTPWIGRTRTRPLILYGPTKNSRGPLTFNKYLPARPFWKPLKKPKRTIMLKAKNVITHCAILHRKQIMIKLKTYEIFSKWQFDNPTKSTSLNANSIFTGLSSPCLIEILGMCNGSTGIKLMPLWPAK